MSYYTTELRYICESLAEQTTSQGYKSVQNIINIATPLIFSFSFPIFDEAYRWPLAQKIIKHYYTREISMETYGAWQLKLDTRINDIMPYYNQLYLSELIKYNPLHDSDLWQTDDRTQDDTHNLTRNADYTGNFGQNDTIKTDWTRNLNRDTTTDNTETHNQTDNRVADTTSNTTSNYTDNRTGTTSSSDIYSDTPQGGLTDVEKLRYLTNARFLSGKSTDNLVHNGTDATTDHTTDNLTTTFATKFDGKIVEKLTETMDETQTNQMTRAEKTDTRTTDDYVAKAVEALQRHTSGKSVGGITYQEMVIKFRETFLNIDMMIINDLSDLFFGLWR